MPDKKRKRGGTRRPVWLIIVAHALALGAALVLYALPHHVIPRAEQAVGIVSTRDSAALALREEFETPPPTQAPTPTPEAPAADEAEADAVPEETPVPTPEPVGSFRNKFADKFTDGEVIQTENSYQSANLNITYQSRYFDAIRSRVHVADIYVADISCLRTVLARDKYGRGYTEPILKVAKRTQSLVTMNGDYYGTRTGGVVIRNGKLYRDQKNIRDVAALFWDGRMEIIGPKQFKAEAAMAHGVYQSWCFGPSLLDGNGRAIQSFNVESGIVNHQPRSVIGYYEPGHYCFVVADGRSSSSYGVKMKDLAKLMEALGCRIAYNLDGGKTSQLAMGTKLVNKPSSGGRDSSDYLIVVDQVAN